MPEASCGITIKVKVSKDIMLDFHTDVRGKDNEELVKNAFTLSCFYPHTWYPKTLVSEVTNFGRAIPIVTTFTDSMVFEKPRAGFFRSDSTLF